MGNLLKPQNQIKSTSKSPRIQITKISEIEEEEEVDVEERMKNLPHWKYAASFTNYIKDLSAIRPDEKEDFLKLYKEKNYKAMYKFLCENK